MHSNVCTQTEVELGDSVAARFRRIAERNADQVALIDGGVALSYRELEEHGNLRRSIASPACFTPR